MPANSAASMSLENKSAGSVCLDDFKVNLLPLFRKRFLENAHQILGRHRELSEHRMLPVEVGFAVRRRASSESY